MRQSLVADYVYTAPPVEQTQHAPRYLLNNHPGQAPTQGLPQPNQTSGMIVETARQPLVPPRQIVIQQHQGHQQPPRASHSVIQAPNPERGLLADAPLGLQVNTDEDDEDEDEIMVRVPSIGDKNDATSKRSFSVGSRADSHISSHGAAAFASMAGVPLTAPSGFDLSPGFSQRRTHEEILKYIAPMSAGNNCFVSLKNCTVTGSSDVSDKEYPTVGSAVVSMFKALMCLRGQRQSKIMLNNVQTCIAPGKLTLVIGPPQSGKSTLLKLIAGQLQTDVQVQGTVKFNNCDLGSEVQRRVCSYVPQIDTHFAAFTVQDTINFSNDCTIQTHIEDRLRTAGINAKEHLSGGRPKVEMMLTLLGLNHVAKSIVGDGVMRGVSGGEKKRVTTAEMAVTPSMVLCMDEISTGLDAAATFDIIRGLKNACNVLKTTVVISLLQPPPDVLKLFDDVMVMGLGGTLIYHGPLSDVESYFSRELGFACPEHIDFADFLVDVCTDDASIYFRGNGPPPSSIEMAERFRRSKTYNDYIAPRFHEEYMQGLDPAKNAVNKAPFNRIYGASYPRLFFLLLQRHIMGVVRDPTFLRQRVGQVTIQGIMIGTIFWQTDQDALKIALFFMFTAIGAMGNMATMPIIQSKRNVFYKQRDSGFYPTILYALSDYWADYPQQILEVSIIGFIVYFFVGFQTSSFGLFYGFLFLSTLMFINLYKAIAVHTATKTAAQGVAMGIMAFSMCFSGFLVARTSIPDFFIWIYWIMPFSWVLRVFCINEFRTPGPNGSYDVITPGGERMGDLLLQSFGIQTGEEWIGYGFAYVIGVTFLSFVVYVYGLHYRRLGVKRPMVVVPRKKTHRNILRRNTAQMMIQGQSFTVPPLVGDNSEADTPFQKCIDALVNVSIKPPPVTIALKNVTYTVKIAGSKRKGPPCLPSGPSTDRKLLNDVNAYFTPGTLTALMGSSGAGKTTLLDVVAGRKTTGKIEGQILINGHPQDLRTFSRVSGYVEQTDIHVPTETVLEALRFSAYHRLPRRMPDMEKEQIIEAVIDMIELRPIIDKVIGQASGSENAGTGLSVEQKKRVTIGVEMVSNPSVIFLDEPTSGLDSRSARVIMRAIRRIAQSGRTVVCTIHQPSFEIFSMFDRLLLLKKGGYTVFNGNLGPPTTSEVTGETFNSAQNMVKYFESCSPVVPKITPGRNPAEYMLECIGAGTGSGAASPQASVDFAACYAASPMARETSVFLQEVRPGIQVEFDNYYEASFQTQLFMSASRWTRSYWRNVGYNLTRMMIVIAVALLFSLNVYDLRMRDVTEQPQLQSFNGVLFAGIFFTCAIQAVMTVPVIGDSKPVYYREIAANMYHPWPYLFGLSVAEIPWLIAVTFMHGVIFYPIANLDSSSDTIVQYLVATFFFSSTFCFFGQMLSALISTTRGASLATAAAIGILNLYAGFFMPESAIPWPWKLIFYISPARFGLKAAMPKQFYCSASCLKGVNGGSIDCNSASFAATASLNDSGGYGPGCSLMWDRTGAVFRKMGKEWSMANIGRQPPYRLTVYDYWSVTTESTEADVWTYTWGLLGFMVGFKLITLISLRFMRHIDR